MTLAWETNAVEGTVYQLVRAEMGIASFEVVYEGTDTVKEVSGMKPLTDYKFKLRYQTNDGRALTVTAVEVKPLWSKDYAEIDLKTTGISPIYNRRIGSYAGWRAIGPCSSRRRCRKSGHSLQRAREEPFLRDEGQTRKNDANGNLEKLSQSASSNGDLDIVKLLLKNGASTKATTTSGKTSLVFAISGGHYEVVVELLKIDPQLLDYADTTGATPLMWAAETALIPKKKGHDQRILKHLLSFESVEVNQEDTAGLTALDRLCMTCGVCEAGILLIDHKARVIEKCDKKHSMTTLMTLAMNGHKEFAMELMNRFDLDPAYENEVLSGI